MRHPLLIRLNQLSTDRWARRGIRTLLRFTWIGLCVCCVGLAGHLLWGWPLQLNVLAAAGLSCVALGAATLLRPPLRPRDAARRLDRRFALGEQLSTALEVAPQRPPADSIPGLLVAESIRTSGQLRRALAARQRPPWVEIATAASLALMLVGLIAMLGLGTAGFDVSADPLPSLAAPGDPNQTFPPTQPQPQPAGQQGGQGAGDQPGSGSDPTAQQSLQAIADALRDQSTTRAVSDALDRGDSAAAAARLRELADQASQLSNETRQNIANSLRDAADQVQGSNPQLANQLRRNADSIEQGGQGAAQALEDLARSVEQLGQPGQQAQQGQDGQQGQGSQPGVGQQGQQGQDGQQGQGQSPGSGAGNGLAGEQRDQPGGRLNAPGVPLELDSQGEGNVPARDNAPASAATGGTGSGFTQGDGSDSGTVQAGDDPLRIPAEDRDVVQDYFSPQN